MRVGIDAGEHRGAGGTAHRLGAVRLPEERAGGGEALQMGHAEPGVLVRTNGVGPLLIGPQQQDVLGACGHPALLSGVLDRNLPPAENLRPATGDGCGG